MSQQSITAHIKKTGAGLLSRLLSKQVILRKMFQPEQRYISALVHEIRNPITTINLAVLMLQSAKSMEEQKKFIDMIIRSSNRISGLVDDLLISQKSDATNTLDLPVQQLLDEVLAIAADRLMLKNISLVKKICPEVCLIRADRQKIKIAITNIIINAIDAMPHNGQLELVLHTENGKCIIEIADNGIGISKDNLHHIFEPYFTKKQHGLGVGLSASLEILSSNHANVIVQSEEGLGTRFILSFKNLANQQDMTVKKAAPAQDFFI